MTHHQRRVVRTFPKLVNRYLYFLQHPEVACAEPLMEDGRLIRAHRHDEIDAAVAEVASLCASISRHGTDGRLICIQPRAAHAVVCSRNECVCQCVCESPAVWVLACLPSGYAVRYFNCGAAVRLSTPGVLASCCHRELRHGMSS